MKNVANTTPFIKLDAFLKFVMEAQTGGRRNLYIQNGIVR